MIEIVAGVSCHGSVTRNRALKALIPSENLIQKNEENVITISSELRVHTCYNL